MVRCFVSISQGRKMQFLATAGGEIMGTLGGKIMGTLGLNLWVLGARVAR